MQQIRPERIVLIGASTGGPAQIEMILRALPTSFNGAVVIAQHMGADFIPSFAKRLNDKVAMPVSLLLEGSQLEAGAVYIANGKVEISRVGSALICTKTLSVIDRYNPDIDLLFHAFVPFAKQCNILAIILTGIGEDGVAGCSALGQEGATCIAEHESSAVVYGMPLHAKERVARIRVESLEEIIASIKEFCN